MDDHEALPGGDLKRSATVEWRERKIDLLKKTRERRERPIAEFEMRESQDGMLKFSGYASITDEPYEVGFFSETIQRGAFKRTLSENPDVQLLINHGDGGSGMPIARTNRNMSLIEDERGLRVEAQLDPDDPDVALLARKMKNGLIDGMSFAFQATDDEWSEDRSKRTIRSVSIHKGDVSVVNQGANGSAMAVLRSQEDLQAFRAFGPENVMRALLEIGEHAALPEEERKGKKISSDSMEVLSRALALAAKGDDALDEIQVILSDYLGVSNPDDDAKRSIDSPAVRAAVTEPQEASEKDADAHREFVIRQRQLRDVRGRK